jgi:DNA-binding CsgD family transcriptional regulator
MNSAGSVLCPIIIGRDDLLALADRRLAEAAAGRGQLLLLAGEAGIGKTRLLGAIGRKATASGFLEANAALAPQDRDVPAALIGDLARSVRRDPDFGTLGDDLLAMRIDRNADALGSRRLYVLDVVDRLVAAIDRPVLFDFEDLQWADEVSLEIVGELARAARGRPLLMVGNYRTEELAPGSFFREWRARLIGQRLAEEARLAPLTQDDTALMTTLILDTGLPAPREVVAAVHERTDGIPLHIEELLGALRGEALMDGGTILDARVPETIEDAIVARLDQLSPEAREVARAGAVIGRCFVPEVLAGIMDRPVSELDEPLRELAEHSYLLPAGARGLIDFRHQLLRDVLYRQVPPTELRRLHARAGEFGAALEGQSEIHASVHFERAGLRTEAFRAALSGAEAASRISARQEAFGLYRRAIDNMPDDLPILEQAELYAMFSNAAAAIEHNAESISAAERARAAYLAAGRPVEAADMHLQVASMPYRDAKPVREVVREVEVALAEIEGLPAGRDAAILRAAAYDVKAFLELDASMIEESLADSRRALDLADDIDDRETALDATFTAARIDILSGRLEQGFSRGLRAAREARDEGFESVGVTAFRNLAISAVRVLDYRTAELALGEGLRYADAIEQSHCRQQMATATALMSWAAGRWDEAVETARQELVERGCRRGELSAIDVLGLVAMSRGEIGEARRWCEESLAAGEALQEAAYLLPPLWALAELDLIVGDANSAADRTSKALEIAIRLHERALLIPHVVTGVRARLAIHRPDEAERWLARARDLLAGWAPVADAALAHAEGLLLLATGSMTAARQSLQAAVRAWEERGRIWETSWARLDLAQCLMRSSRYGEAANLLATVRETAESLGSAPLLARADDLSRVARGRGTLEEPWRPLTAREFEVARLIAEGLTNGEIAQRLDIAPKTASAHVEHILAKLGVTRRAEIAAWTATVLRPEARMADGHGGQPGQRPPERRAAAVR